MIRSFDFCFAFFGLLLLSPVLVMVAFLVWLEGGSPLFFQDRVGRHQKPLKLVKFRTMRQGTASVATHLVDASAITFVGRLLRYSKLDELPQLWNVLCGDMSLVGPRPGLQSQVELTLNREAHHVYEVKPGITGLAQTKGYRGEIKSDEDIVNRVKYDIFYIKNWSFLLDVKIIFQTVWLMVFGDKKAY